MSMRVHSKGATLFARVRSLWRHGGKLKGSDTSNVGQVDRSSTTSPRGIGYSGHKLKSFTFPGTLSGYRSSKRHRDDSHPHRLRSEYGDGDTPETVDGRAGARHRCDGRMLVHCRFVGGGGTTTNSGQVSEPVRSVRQAGLNEPSSQHGQPPQTSTPVAQSTPASPGRQRVSGNRHSTA